MAPRAEPLQSPEVDALPGVPLPHERERLIGHQQTELALLDAYRSERLHHAWILGGPKGIGKATIAYRFARFVIAYTARFSDAVANASNLAVDPAHPVARQIRAGGHPNILHLRRPWDEKRKRFKSDLPVDEVRRTVGFFGTTASASSWRICIIDSADDMNANSANALLKILEEPPARCLFLVLSHAPGRLLPTIRSRCRHLDMAVLSREEIIEGLHDLAPERLPSPSELIEIARFADGSLRSALTLMSGDGLAIARGFAALADNAASLDLRALHGLGDLVAARGETDNWENFQHAARAWLHERMRLALRQDIHLAMRYADLWEHAIRLIAESDALNLDRKQVVLDIGLALAKLAK